MHLTGMSHVYEKAHYLQGATIIEYAFKMLSYFETAIYQTAVRFLQHS